MGIQAPVFLKGNRGFHREGKDPGSWPRSSYPKELSELRNPKQRAPCREMSGPYKSVYPNPSNDLGSGTVGRKPREACGWS